MRIMLRDAKDFKKTIMSKGFSQKRFAEVMQISQPFMNQIIKGDRGVSPATAEKMGKKLRKKFHDLFIFVEPADKAEVETEVHA